jgi:hypothetical protein
VFARFWFYFEMQPAEVAKLTLYQFELALRMKEFTDERGGDGGHSGVSHADAVAAMREFKKLNRIGIEPLGRELRVTCG